MGTGFPGTGLATIFYVLSVLAMPVVHAQRSLLSGSAGSALGYRRMGRHLLLAALMGVALVGTVLVLPDVDLPASPLRTRTSTWVGTGLVFAVLLVLSLYPLRTLYRRVAQLAAVAGVCLLVVVAVHQQQRGVEDAALAPQAVVDADGS